ncbi:MAG TPA: polysaccharide deacetylase family protein [Actinoplanes sp.]|nr:polysaccharide deacetylase family protein [Actinoplanes sp.]
MPTLLIVAALVVNAITGPAPAPPAQVTEIVLQGPAAAPLKTVALTFDDGPSRHTAPILDILYRHRVPATFCLLGDNAEAQPHLARRIAREGHQICNHSRSHPDLARASADRVRGEVAVAQWQITRATGVRPRTFRFPYGSSDARAERIVRRYGLRPLDWDVDPQDWTRPRSGTITARVVRQVRPGSVVLLHDGGGDRRHTVAALETIVGTLRAQGYRFVLPPT